MTTRRYEVTGYYLYHASYYIYPNLKQGLFMNLASARRIFLYSEAN
jgi:hypothetical protein